MPSTKWGVYYNLPESKYTASNGEVVFYFSSEVTLNKFLTRVAINRENYLIKWSKCVDQEIYNGNTLADIYLYREIESNRSGNTFVRLKGVKITWLELHQYALRKMTEKNTPDWLRMQRRKQETS